MAKLKADAVPTLFQHLKLPQKRRSSEHRAEEFQKRAFVDDALAKPLSPPPMFSELAVQTIPSLFSKETQTPHFKCVSKGIQHGCSSIFYREVSCQTDTPLTRDFGCGIENNDNNNEFEASFSSVASIYEEDSDYEPDSSDCSDIEDEEVNPSTVLNSNTNDVNAYIVFWPMLLQLLTFCLNCRCAASITNIITRGSQLTVTLLCINGHQTSWNSQPSVRGMSQGNLLISASILFTGNTFGRISELFNTAKVKFFSKSTYNEIQRNYLFPVINKWYISTKKVVLNELRVLPSVDLVGDGRCDSPGYNAKYCTYSFMDPQTDKIIDFALIHVGQCTNSSTMEKFGFIQLLDGIEKEGINIGTISTDRHVQVRAYLKKVRPDIRHQFDVWHVSKNIKKKLSKKSQISGCQALAPWIKSIINHFWWSCQSCNGNYVELVEKWKSVLNHIKNNHRWNGNQVFKKCNHGKLRPEDRNEIAWLTEDSQAYKALEEVVLNKILIADLKFVTDFTHTGNIEVFHSLINKYCPKRQHFRLHGMIARQQLTVLDHNNSVGRDQAVTRSGELRGKSQYSKVTKQWVWKPIRVEKDRSYLQPMVRDVITMRETFAMYPLPDIPILPRNIAPIESPSISTLKQVRSRFSSDL